MTNQTKTIQTLLILSLLIFVAGIIIGTKFTAPNTSAPSTPSLFGQLTSALCYTSLAVLAVVLLAAAVMGGYYGKRRLDAQARIWKAEADRREAAVERSRLQAHDLTPGPDGQEVARLLQTPEGRYLLLKPGVATSPVTVVDSGSATQPDQTSEQLALMALLSQALRRPGGLPARSGAGPDGLLAALLLNRQSMDERVPDNVRVLTAEEVRVLEDGRRGR